jgi:hypothetical protein
MSGANGKNGPCNVRSICDFVCVVCVANANCQTSLFSLESDPAGSYGHRGLLCTCDIYIADAF